MIKTLLLLFAFAFSLCGCTHYYYMPNQHNVPMFKEKDEVRISGSYVTGDDAKGFELQGGYAFAKNAAVLANLCVINPQKGADGNGQLCEIGAGFYKPFAKYLVFENYGFVGFGQSQGVFHIDSMPDEYAHAGFIKVYDQPSIGFSLDYFDLILSQKIGVLSFYKMEPGSYPVRNSNLTGDIDLVSKNRVSFFMEPALTLRAGYKWAKLSGQVGYTFLSNNIRERSGSWNFNLGVSISLAPRFRLKRK